MLLCVLLACLTLNGCATRSVDKGLNALMWQNVSTAFNVLGYPDGKQEFGEKDVYVWTRVHSRGMVLPQVATTYQNIGPASVSGNIGTTPVYGTVGPQTVATTSITSQYVPMTSEFLIKLVAERKTGAITNYEWSGNQMGAQEFASRLHNYYLSTKQSKPTPGTLPVAVNTAIKGLYYSPYVDRADGSKKNGIFDASGHKSGTKLACPYTGRQLVLP